MLSALAGCSPEPAPGALIAGFTALDADGRPIGRGDLHVGKARADELIERVEIRDEEGRLVTSTVSSLRLGEETRFWSRLRFMGAFEEIEAVVSSDAARWRRKRGLAVWRGKEEVSEPPVLLDWALLPGEGPRGSLALFHHLARTLGEEGASPRVALNVRRGRQQELFVSARESCRIELDGAEVEARRYFIGTRASGHTMWIDARSGRLLSVDNVLGATFRVEGFTIPERPNEPPPPSLIEEHLTLRLDDVELSGTLTVPARAGGPAPLVILVHGSGPMDRDQSPFMIFRHLAHDLGAAGVAVLRYDKRGVGESLLLGEAADHTLDALAADARAWVHHLASRPDIDEERIAVAGHSEGGYIAPLVALAEPSVSRVVLLAGAPAPLLEVLREQARLVAEAHGMTPKEADEVLHAQQAVIGRVRSTAPPREGEKEMLAWLRSHDRHDPEATLRALDLPVLAVFAEGDVQVPVGQAAKMDSLAGQMAPGQVTVRVLDGLDHVLMDDRGGRSGLGLLADPDRRIDQRVPSLIARWLLESS